jgi:AcrR family transcriptional regulator
MPRITAGRKEQRRSQILNAAAACFARQGFHQTTMQDICAEAGLSAGAVYGYFDSKDAIIAMLAQAARRVGAERFAAARDAATSVDRLERLLGELERPRNPWAHQLDVRLWGEAISDAELRALYVQSRAALIEALIAITGPLATAHGLAPEALAELLAAVIAGCELRMAIQPESSARPIIATLRALLAVGIEGSGA